MEESTDDQKAPEADREHDLLSFLSVIFREYNSYDLNFTLLGVIIKESFDMRPVGAGGSYFQVYKANGKSLLAERTFGVSFPDEDSFPELVAIKSPIIKGEVNSARNRKIWTALARELMVLKHPHLSKHDNIVSLLGVCWNPIAETSSIMPALVLEAAETDLDGFMAPGRAVERRKLMGLAIDVVTGVQAIHACEIAHCDIKPKNILIFKHPDLGYTAKVADFGCAILLNNLKDKIMPPGATEFWQAPECSQPLSGNGLKKADIYSTGLIVWNLLTGNMAVTTLDMLKGHDKQLFKDAPDDAKTKETVLYMLIQETVKATWEFPPTDIEPGTGVEPPKKSDVELLLTYTLCFPPKDRPSAKNLLKNLRILTHQLLYYETLRDSTDLDTPKEFRKMFNSQEQDIWFNPDLGKPSDENRERAMQFANSMEWLEETIAAAKSSRSFKMKDLATYKAVNPEKWIGSTMKQWKMARQPAPDAQEEVSNSLAVPMASHAFGTLRLTPRRVVDQVCQQLRAVALNTKEPKARRAESAYQYSILAIGRLQFWEGASAEIDTCLKMSSLAANLDHTMAQSITSSLHYAFQKTQSQEDVKVELKWLRRGVKHGSLAAKRRLQKINPGLFLDAKHALRHRYIGIGIKLPWMYKYLEDEQFEAKLQEALKMESEKERIRVLTVFIMLGRRQESEQLLGAVDVNSTNEGQETPLLFACRVGDAHMVRILLDAGANPNIASIEGVTPLHFLAAFDEQDIRPVAFQLAKKGAKLETRSTVANEYRSTYDSTFGQANGTPLLWAVAADNVVATKVLVELGADPFDLLSRTAPRTNEFGNLVWTSPVVYAATKHQYYLLDIMLAPQKKSILKTLKSAWLPSTKHKLNDNRREFGTRGLITDESPLIWCVTYAGEGLTKRLLLHGPEHEVAFIKTFEVLVGAGADPLSTDSQGNTLMFIAALYGQPFIINYLMNWNENLLRPGLEQWVDLVKTAVFFSDYIVFQTLLQYHPTEELDAQSLASLFNGIASHSDDVRYLDPFKASINPTQDLTDALQLALQHSNLAVMRWLWATGRCDVTRQEDDRSVLGYLIQGAKTFDSRVRGMEALLDLEDLPDSAFYNCFTLYKSRLTALQAAVLHFEYWEGKKAAEWSVHMIVNRWSEPEYLNHQIAEGRYKGYTALHIAVQYTNLEAIRYLLDEVGEDLDLSVRDERDLTPLDLALLQLQDQKSVMDFWQVPAEKQAAADQLHWENTVLMIAGLSAAGAKPFRIASAWVRPEPDDLAHFPAWHLKDSTFTLMPDMTKNAEELFAMTTEEVQKYPSPIREASRLAINQAIFVVSQEYIEAQNLKTSAEASITRHGGDDTASQPDPQASHITSQLGTDNNTASESLNTLVEHLQLNSDGRHGTDAS